MSRIAGFCPPKNCTVALGVARQTPAALKRAVANWPTLSTAASAHSIDPRLLAAVGVRETGFQNIDQKNGYGRGVFQIDIGANPSVSAAQAHNLTFASNWAANALSENFSALKSAFSNFDPTHLLQATAASYNFGLTNISGNPNTIDVGTTGGNYGSNVVQLMNCF